MDKIYDAVGFGAGLLITGAFAKKTLDIVSKGSNALNKKRKKRSRK